MKPTNLAKKNFFEGFSLFAMMMVLLIIIFTTASTDAPLILVITGFLPSILTIVLCITLYEESIHTKITTWAIPLAIVAVFFIVGDNYPYLKSNLDIGVLASLNLFVIITYLAVFVLLTKILYSERQEKPKIARREITIKEKISSLEEKSKALNFVVGRVYNKKTGGNKEMREIINFKSDWYNELSEALSKEKGINNPRLHTIIEQIKHKVYLLEKQENQVFSEKQLGQLKGLKRKKDGTSKIIEVLNENDKDPVELYYKGIKEFLEDL